MILVENGIDLGTYGFCALAELKNALRFGEMWVTGSRRFGHFDDHLLAGTDYTTMKNAGERPQLTANDGEDFLKAVSPCPANFCTKSTLLLPVVNSPGCWSLP